MPLLSIGDEFVSTLPMSTPGEVWVVEQIGRLEIKMSGLWFRQHQIERWIHDGKLVHTKRASAQE